MREDRLDDIVLGNGKKVMITGTTFWAYERQHLEEAIKDIEAVLLKHGIENVQFHQVKDPLNKYD